MLSRPFLQELSGKLAMHVVGAQPKYLSRQAVPEAALADEKQLLTEQALKSGERGPRRALGHGVQDPG